MCRETSKLSSHRAGILIETVVQNYREKRKGYKIRRVTGIWSVLRIGVLMGQIHLLVNFVGIRTPECQGIPRALTLGAWVPGYWYL